MSDGLGNLRGNPAYQACIAELDRLRIPHTVEFGGKHPKIVFEFRGKTLRVSIAGTPSDNARGAKNAAAYIRRMISSVEAKHPRSPETAIVSVNQRIETMDAGQLVVAHDGRVVVSSRRMAEVFGKQHKNVLRDIDVLLDVAQELRLNFEPTEEPDGFGRLQRVYQLDRRGFSLLAMGFTGDKALRWKIRFYDAFDAMETVIQKRSPDTAFLNGLSSEAGLMIGGIVKVVVRKALNDDRQAAGELLAEEIAKLTKRIDAIALPAPAAIPAADVLTAYEVIAGPCEVPKPKLFAGLPGQISAKLALFCASNAFQISVVETRPGKKFAFPRAAVIRWLEEGGRADVWRLVTAHSARRGGQTVMAFPRSA